MIKWSFSGLKQFLNCPRQYHEVKVLRNFVVQETEQIRYGKEVHRALEDYVRDGKPLPKNYRRFKKVVDALVKGKTEIDVEVEMALNFAREPCQFDSPEYWVRGIADLLMVEGDTAFVVDYKTGSAKYPDAKQLKLMALMTFAYKPQVQKVKGGLLFLLHDVFIPAEYHRKDIDALWASFDPDLFRLKQSTETDHWLPNPTPLCGWCPVNTCQFYKER